MKDEGRQMREDGRGMKDEGRRTQPPLARRNAGQVVLEYAVLVAIVAAAFMAMAFYVKRAVQGKINLMDDQVTAKSDKYPQGFVWVPWA